RPQPARHQSDKRYTHTCIRIRFLFNPLHIATPARPNPVVCISFVVHLLDLQLLLAFCCSSLHPATWTKQTYVSEYFGAATSGHFFVSQIVRIEIHSL